MVAANEENQMQFINRYLEEQLKIDYWWMDAGWYLCDGNWGRTGTWEVDTKRFPRGLRAISDHAHSKGIKTIVWFEPERVAPGTWLAENQPNWILGGKNGGLLNLGNPEARQWLTDHVSKLITVQGIDLYRQDFNMDPLYGLDPEVRYRVRNLNSAEADIIMGRQLMDIGLPVVLNNRPSAVVITYEKVGE
jgi:alpha-galactosidase